MDNKQTNTKNLNLNLIYKGIGNWCDYLNDNFDILDNVVAEQNKSNSVISGIEPSTHKAGRVWIDKINQDGKVITGKYKIDNGTDYNEMHFETEAELVKCKDGKNVEEKIKELNTNTTQEITNLKEDIEKEIKNIDLEASKVKVDNSNFKSQNVDEALTELFQYADNGKKDWAEVIGEPLKNSDSFSTLKSKTQSIKDKLVENLKENGLNVKNEDTFSVLVKNINNLSSQKNIKGIYSIATTLDAYDEFVGSTSRFIYVMRFSDKKRGYFSIQQYNKQGNLVYTKNYDKPTYIRGLGDGMIITSECDNSLSHDYLNSIVDIYDENFNLLKKQWETNSYGRTDIGVTKNKIIIFKNLYNVEVNFYDKNFNLYKKEESELREMSTSLNVKSNKDIVVFPINAFIGNTMYVATNDNELYTLNKSAQLFMLYN